VQKYLSQPKLIEKVLPYEDALEAMQKLATAGYEIHIASSRKEPLHQSTIKWLKQHGFDRYIERIHPRSSEKMGHEFKKETAQLTGAVAAFDDTLGVARAMAEVIPMVYLINKPWNQGKLPENIIRVSSFTEAVNIFLSLQRTGNIYLDRRTHRRTKVN